MTWDLWVDFQRTDSDGMTHASMRNAAAGTTIERGSYIIVGNEDADDAAALVNAIDHDGIVLLTVLPGPVTDHLSLLSAGSRHTTDR